VWSGVIPNVSGGYTPSLAAPADLKLETPSPPLRCGTSHRTTRSRHHPGVWPGSRSWHGCRFPAGKRLVCLAADALPRSNEQEKGRSRRAARVREGGSRRTPCLPRMRMHLLPQQNRDPDHIAAWLCRKPNRPRERRDVPKLKTLGGTSRPPALPGAAQKARISRRAFCLFQTALRAAVECAKPAPAA
jgi:hypothetical protein